MCVCVYIRDCLQIPGFQGQPGNSSKSLVTKNFQEEPGNIAHTSMRRNQRLMGVIYTYKPIVMGDIQT